jgi:xylose isomerase
MKVTKQALAKLDTVYKGYLEGAKVDALLRDFGINFAAGHWCAGPFADRFAPGGYTEPDELDGSIFAQIKRVAAAGIKGIEFHENVFTDAKFRKVPRMVKKVREATKRTGLTPTNMNMNLWGVPFWKLGSVCNPDPRVRKAALAVALQAVDIAKEVGCSSVALWPGADGWDYNFEVNYGVLLDRFIDACAIISRRAADEGLKFGTEAKLHEPREGNMVVATSQKAMLIAQEVNRITGVRNMGIAIDYGHEQMYAYEPADNLYLAKRMGVPVVNFHLNNSKVHSNDEDRVTGTGDNWRMADFCYAAIDTGYQGWFGEDQFTYRMEPVQAMSLSREFFANIMKKALLIYRDRAKLQKAQATGDSGKTIEVVKRIMV